MKVLKIFNTIIVIGATKEDLRHLYLRTSLSNNDLTKAIGEGFGDKKVPDTSFGCAFKHIFNGIWD